MIAYAACRMQKQCHPAAKQPVKITAKDIDLVDFHLCDGCRQQYSLFRRCSLLEDGCAADGRQMAVRQPWCLSWGAKISDLSQLNFLCLV